MKRGSRVLIFLVLVILILVAIAFFVIQRGLFSGGAGATQTPVPVVNLVFVSQPINMDDEIKDESLEYRPFPGNPSAGMITDKQQVIGKYAAFNLPQGVPLTTGMVAERPGLNQPGSQAAKVVSPGLVAISIPISRLGSVAYAIRDGDRVNVIATARFIDVDANFQSKLPNFTAKVTGPGFIPDTLPVISASLTSAGLETTAGRTELDPTLNQPMYYVPSESQRSRLVSQMILQDIQVLHMGDFSITDAQSSSPQPTPEAGATPVPTPVPPLPTVITLIVTPQDAVALTYFMNSGTQFTLALRAPDDTTRIETEAATLQYLLSQYAIPVPAKLPYVMDNPTATPAP